MVDTATQPAVPETAAPQVEAAPTPAQLADDDAAKSARVIALLKAAIAAGNVPEIVANIINYAITIRTSDIHIEPDEGEVRVRLRVDGKLLDAIHYPKPVHPAIVARVKIIANLKIDESRMPQDGRARFVFEVEDLENPGKKKTAEADLRVSTLPTVNGEKIVMRIQDKSKKIPALEQLGIEGSNFMHIRKVISSPNGVFLVSGPTGSGKTTTLYSALTILNEVSENIMTLEDPVEYQMSGLNQSQVRPDIGYNFANGLRTALRQDPDIIMLGEIRDLETIEIAIQAALTGHFVLSTIHTNSAIETITRIQNMGVQNFLITSAVKGIMAQRLIRRVCVVCKESYTPEPTLFADLSATIQGINPMEEIDATLLENVQLYRGKGCAVCNNTGYKGRVGIYEVLMMSDELRKMILENRNVRDMEHVAIQGGMLTLKQDGTLKALRGDTSIEEVYRMANEH